jgi:hypothetical protein
MGSATAYFSMAVKWFQIAHLSDVTVDVIAELSRDVMQNAKHKNPVLIVRRRIVHTVYTKSPTTEPRSTLP